MEIALIRDISDEIPFEIPESWEWVRLGDLVYLIGGTSYKKNEVKNSVIKILRGGNIQSAKLYFLMMMYFSIIPMLNPKKILELVMLFLLLQLEVKRLLVNLHL